MRTLRGTRGAALVATGLTVGVLCATYAGSAVAVAAIKPDLVITELKVEELGEHPYLLIGPSGVARGFLVEVVTMNEGGTTAPASVTSVVIDDGADVPLTKLVAIPALKSKGAKRSLVSIRDYKPLLGLAQIVVTADAHKKVAESHETNNKRVSEDIPVVARTWDVEHFSTDQNLPGAVTDTHAEPDFHFQFAEFDPASETFDYTAVGDIATRAEQLLACPGVGTSSGSHTDWAHSFFTMGAKLTTYGAFIKASAEPPFIVHLVCVGGTTFDAPFSFLDLDTFVGVRAKPHMTPSQTTLSASVANPLLHLLFVWEFKARIHP